MAGTVAFFWIYNPASLCFCVSIWPYYVTSASFYLCNGQTFHLNIGLNMLPLDSFMPCLDYPLGYFTGEFQALQLIVLAMFGAMD